MAETQVVKYDLNTAAIAEMKSLYMELRITDLEDKEQFDSVHSARMVVKNHRVALDKAVKGYNDQANKFKKEVKEKAKPLYDGLEPIETHLMDEENKVLEAEKRKKEEEDRIERERLQAMTAELQKYGVVMSFVDLAMLSEGEYQARLEKARADYEAEQKRLKDELMARENEAKRLVAEAERLEKLRQEQEARERAENEKRIAEEKKLADERAAIQAEKKALEDEKRKEQERKEREAFEKQAAEEAKIKAEADAKAKAEKEARENLERAAREIKEAKEREEAEKAEAERLEALKPDREKLTAFAQFLQGGMSYPSMATDDGKRILSDSVKQIYDIGEEILQELEKL